MRVASDGFYFVLPYPRQLGVEQAEEGVKQKGTMKNRPVEVWLVCQVEPRRLVGGGNEKRGERSNSRQLAKASVIVSFKLPRKGKTRKG